MDSQTEPRREFTDCHVHLAALPHEGNGCYISPRMLKSPLFRFLLWKFKLDINDPARTNAKYVGDLLAELRGSRYVGRAILLGMDGAYDERGKLDEQATEFLIANDYVLKVAKTYPEDFWAGVSINPQRGDALEELARCAEAGAKLVKVLPNAQQFNPGDRRYIPFYRALAQRRLPLLSHVGYEFSLVGKDQSAGDPNKLRVPLDEGVAVIAAHGCSYGLVFHEKFYGTFVELCRSYTNFFSDISALTLVNRFGMLLKLRRHPELHGRLLFGTDYPLPVLHAPCWGRVGLRGMKEILRTKSRFDRQYLVCRELKVGPWALYWGQSRSRSAPPLGFGSYSRCWLASRLSRLSFSCCSSGITASAIARRNKGWIVGNPEVRMGPLVSSEQGTAFCAVSDDRKQTTYAFVSWRVHRYPGTIPRGTASRLRRISLLRESTVRPSRIRVGQH